MKKHFGGCANFWWHTRRGQKASTSGSTVVNYFAPAIQFTLDPDTSAGLHEVLKRFFFRQLKHFFAARARITLIWINLWGLSFKRRKIYPQKWWVKRNWVSKKQHTTCDDGAEAPCVIIHSFEYSHKYTLARSEHTFFSFYFIPNRFHTFTRAPHRRKKDFSSNTLVVVPKALFLKWNFMSDCGIPFHHRVAPGLERRVQREEKSPVEMWWWKEKNCGFELWGIFLLLRLVFL